MKLPLFTFDIFILLVLLISALSFPKKKNSALRFV